MLLLFATGLLFASCSNGTESRSSGSSLRDSLADARGATRAAEALRIRDDLGRALSFPRVPRRIVSLAPSITESFFAIGAGDLLVGVTSYCTYPEAATTLPRVGDMLMPDIERIIALKPDLVVLSIEGNRRETFDALLRLDVPCLVTQPRTLDGVLASLRLLGSVTGRSREAGRLADSLAAIRGQARSVAADTSWPDGSRRIERDAQHPSVLMVLSIDPLIVVGAGTFLDELISLAGGRNAGRVAEQPYPALSREDVLTRNPDMLLLPTDLQITGRMLAERHPEWSRVTAVRRGAVHLVDADVFLRPGPRVFSGLATLTRLLATERSPHR